MEAKRGSALQWIARVSKRPGKGNKTEQYSQHSGHSYKSSRSSRMAVAPNTKETIQGGTREMGALVASGAAQALGNETSVQTPILPRRWRSLERHSLRVILHWFSGESLRLVREETNGLHVPGSSDSTFQETRSYPHQPSKGCHTPMPGCGRITNGTMRTYIVPQPLKDLSVSLSAKEKSRIDHRLAHEDSAPCRRRDQHGQSSFP